MACGFSEDALQHALGAFAKMHNGDKAFGKLDLGASLYPFDGGYGDDGDDPHDIFRAELGCSVRAPPADRALHIRHPIGQALRAADVEVRFDSALAPLCLGAGAGNEACACSLDALLALACRPNSLELMQVCADYRDGPSKPWTVDRKDDVIRLRRHATRNTSYEVSRGRGLLEREQRALDALCHFLLAQLVLPDFRTTLGQEPRFAAGGVGCADLVAVGLALDDLDLAQFCAGMRQLRAVVARWVCGMAACKFYGADLQNLWRECGRRAVERYLEFRYCTLYVLHAGVRALVHYLACPEPVVYGPLTFEPSSQGAPGAGMHWYRARYGSTPFREAARVELERAHVLCMQFARSPVMRAAAARLSMCAPDVSLLDEAMVLGALMWRWFYLHELVVLLGHESRAWGQRVQQIQTLSDAAGLHWLPPADAQSGYACVVRAYEHLVRFVAPSFDAVGNSNVVVPRWPWLETASRGLPPLPDALCANPWSVGDGDGEREAPDWRWIEGRCAATAADIVRWAVVPAGADRVPLITASRPASWADLRDAFMQPAPHTERWMAATRPFLRAVPPYSRAHIAVVEVVQWTHAVPRPPDARFTHVDYQRRAGTFAPGQWALDAHTIGRVADELIAHFVPDARQAEDGGASDNRITLIQFVALYVYWTRHCQSVAPPIVMGEDAAQQFCAALARHLIARAGGGDNTRRRQTQLARARIWTPRAGSVFATLLELAGAQFAPMVLLRQLCVGGGRRDELTNVLWDARCRRTAQAFGF
jgi:hypothetical protein